MKIVSKFIKNIYPILAIQLLLAISFSSCEKTDTPIAAPTSNIMVVNALATATSTPVHFYLDTQRITMTGLAYANTPNYVVVSPNYSAATFKNSSTMATITTAPVQLTAKNSYSMFLYGTAAAPLTLFTQDDLTAPPPGKSRIRIVNLAQSVGSNVDFAVRNDYQTTPTSNVILTNTAYGSSSSFVVVDSCTNYGIQVFATGTSTVKVSSSKITILPNLNYTILVRGILGGTPAIAIQAPINSTVF
jgi:hypothetical protein